MAFPIPCFVAEMAQPANRPKLWFGVWSGFAITIGFVLIVGWTGLLATVAALTTHFLLLRAPLTMDVSSWRFTTTVVLLGAVVSLGLAGVAIATGRLQPGSSTIRGLD